MKRFIPISAIALVALLMSVFVSQPLLAQKVETKAKQVSYIRLPLFQLPEGIKKYSSRVYFNKFLTEALKKTELEQATKDRLLGSMMLDGYEKVEDKPDIMLVTNLSISKPLTSHMVVKNRTLRYKQKEGDKEVEKEIEYQAYLYQVNMGEAKASFQMKTSTGVYLDRTINVGDKTYTFGTDDYDKRYKDATSAKAAWQAEGQKFVKEVVNSVFPRIPSDISQMLGEYCLRKSLHYLELEDIGEAKGKTEHQYDDYDQAVETFFQGLDLLKSDSIAVLDKLVRPQFENAKSKIKEAIAIWDKMLAEADLKDNKARVNKKIAKLIYFNLAKCYTWIEDFPKAKEYLQLRWENKGGFLGMGDKSVNLNRFEKFLQSQEFRLGENSWRTIYRNATPSELARIQKKETIAKPIDYAKPARLYIYADGSGVSDAKYTILLNNQRIDPHSEKGKSLIEPGNALVYDIYSEGFLQISLARVDDNGDIVKLGYDFNSLLLTGAVGLLAANLVGSDQSANLIAAGLAQGISGASTMSTTANALPILSNALNDYTYQNFRKTDQYVHVQPGGSYYFRINFIDKSINDKEEIEGETEFYRRTGEKKALKALEEDTNLPIPNMSIFNNYAKSNLTKQ